MRIDVRINDQRVIDALNQISRAGKDLRPVMRHIGEGLLNSTRERFNTQESPGGSPWAPLSETTLARKRRNQDKILTESGDLRRDIVYSVGDDFVEIGSSRIYAGTHQFGASKGEFGSTEVRGREVPLPWGDIPDRPFLGLSDDDRRDIADAIFDHLKKAIINAAAR